MTERLLQYIWQLRHYNCRQLRTEQGERLEVLYPGAYNSNQGPDFLEAKILINGTLWVGNIELHLRTSDWKKHTHHTDDKYKNVIMHVVWQHDLPGGAYFNMPTLELQPYVSALLLNRYGDMMLRSSFIPCENSVKDVPALVWDTWKERLMLERLQSKALHVKKLLEENNYNWEEALWWMIARNFGMKVNSEAFEAIARSVPFITLGRHRNQIHQTEALLFGQAGLLDKQFKGQYPLMLQKEYRFLKRKYQLEPVNIPLLFLRMRPPNFPSVRLAQLAMFIKTYSHFFSTISECIHLKDVASLLQVTANDYWNYHYRFDECSNFQPKTLGESTVNNIIINAVVPVLYYHGVFHHSISLVERVLGWLRVLPAEKNTVATGWIKAGIIQKDAFTSQALLELKTKYCDHKRCLECAAGNAILKNLADPAHPGSLTVGTRNTSVGEP